MAVLLGTQARRIGSNGTSVVIITFRYFNQKLIGIICPYAKNLLGKLSERMCINIDKLSVGGVSYLKWQASFSHWSLHICKEGSLTWDLIMYASSRVARRTIAWRRLISSLNNRKRDDLNFGSLEKSTVKCHSFVLSIRITIRHVIWAKFSLRKTFSRGFVSKKPIGQKLTLKSARAFQHSSIEN